MSASATYLVLSVAALAPLYAAANKSGIRPIDLRTGDAVAPLAVETDTPTLSWKLTELAGDRGKR